ncbi:hypothetical protein V6N13_132026 [Hibiscus sabdariffa]
MASKISEPWIVIGDFNATLSVDDRSGCAPSSLPEPGFQNMVFDCGLSDLDYVGPDFTWCRGNHYVRLDRYFGNAAWFECYPDSCLHHLLRMKSDHRPILLSLSGSSHSLHHKPFRYLSAWTLHHDFNRLVKENWDSSLPIAYTIDLFVSAAKVWNRDIFGIIGKNKRILMARLRGVQRSLGQRRTRSLLKLESKLLQDLEMTLDQEEQLWKQKSRTDWINFGDRNTSYYHSKAVIRKRRKKIRMLKIDEDMWCGDDNFLREAATNYFENLFTDGPSPSSPFPFLGFFPSFSDVDRNWSIVGPSVCVMVHGIFNGATIDPSLNRTSIVLIPETTQSETFVDFRPIC